MGVLFAVAAAQIRGRRRLGSLPQPRFTATVALVRVRRRCRPG
jgi:hypothetical protein